MFTSVGFSESLNIMFIHFDSLFSFDQSFILPMFIRPRLWCIFPLINEVIASTNSLEIKNIVFVFWTIDELINMLSTVK